LWQSLPGQPCVRRLESGWLQVSMLAQSSHRVEESGTRWVVLRDVCFRAAIPSLTSAASAPPCLAIWRDTFPECVHLLPKCESRERVCDNFHCLRLCRALRGDPQLRLLHRHVGRLVMGERHELRTGRPLVRSRCLSWGFLFLVWFHQCSRGQSLSATASSPPQGSNAGRCHNSTVMASIRHPYSCQRERCLY